MFCGNSLSHSLLPLAWIKYGMDIPCNAPPSQFFVSSAEVTTKMLMPDVCCGALQKYFKVSRKEAKGTDAEQVLKEVQDGVKAALE